MILDADKALAVLCKRRFFRFLQEFWAEVIPEKPVYNWHIPYLCDQLEGPCRRLVNRQPVIEDIVINIPPGQTKSTIVTQALPAWLWTQDPTLRTLSASYGDTLSTSHGVKSRDIIKSAKYKRLFPEVAIKADENNKRLYKTTAGGERMCTSVGGTGTGFHAHLIVCDDIINPHAAQSETVRNEANDFMDTTLSTRKVDADITLTILIMQRLHENDPTGHWINKGKKFHHICLPGELSDKVKPAHLKDLYTDGLLNPLRLGHGALEILRTDLGSYGYAGQIGQTPTPESGGIWDKTWIIPIAKRNIPPLTSIGKDWDLAYTKEHKNSASAHVEAGLNGGNMYITGCGYVYKEFPGLINHMTALGGPHYIEAKASGKSAKQVLKFKNIVAVEVEIEGGGDKVGRTRLATPHAEAGFVYCDEKYLPLLLHDVKQGILTFPNTGTDLNDALVQSINRLLKRKRNKIRGSSVR